ncbi:hypothetical protein EBS80_03710, partial [bacterium]|nr:hypothetical protein [bacterium]
GEVTAIDTSSNEITVVPARSEDSSVTGIVVQYDGDTVFRHDDADASEGDVSVGDIIHVRGTAHLSDGTLSITDVETIAILSGGHVDHEDEPEDSSDDSSDEEDVSLPDLVVDQIDSGDGDTLEITLKNEGDVDVESNDFTVYVWLDGELTWTYSASTLSDQGFLQEGESTTITPQTLDGDTTVKACVDYGDDIEESDETNNCTTEEVNLG